jgi:ribose 5-phosphate isomerase B
MMRIGFAADHGGFELKNNLVVSLRERGYDIEDFGASELNPDDDYPDFVVPLAEAVARGAVDRGIAVCGSGVGACIAANKVSGARAALITEIFSARQGVEDDNMNIICLGGRVITYQQAWEFANAFLDAKFKGGERFLRRLEKIRALEK